MAASETTQTALSILEFKARGEDVMQFLATIGAVVYVTVPNNSTKRLSWHRLLFERVYGRSVNDRLIDTFEGAQYLVGVRPDGWYEVLKSLGQPDPLNQFLSVIDGFKQGASDACSFHHRVTMPLVQSVAENLWYADDADQVHVADIYAGMLGKLRTTKDLNVVQREEFVREYADLLPHEWRIWVSIAIRI